jgi:uncharacterized SAM-binding protein YcdF (DUF218 family)
MGNIPDRVMQVADLYREYIKQNPEIETLILVTSPSHTRRAVMIFHKALKKANPNICILTRIQQLHR